MNKNIKNTLISLCLMASTFLSLNAAQDQRHDAAKGEFISLFSAQENRATVDAFLMTVQQAPAKSSYGSLGAQTLTALANNAIQWLISHDINIAMLFEAEAAHKRLFDACGFDAQQRQVIAAAIAQLLSQNKGHLQHTTTINLASLGNNQPQQQNNAVKLSGKELMALFLPYILAYIFIFELLRFNANPERFGYPVVHAPLGSMAAGTLFFVPVLSCFALFAKRLAHGQAPEKKN